VEATFGDYDRTDLRASYDVTLVEDKLFLRLAGASKHRDGYQTQLDFTCDMIARGTPELAGIGDGVVGWNADPDGPFGPLTGSPIMGVVGSAEDNAFSLPSRRRGGGQITQDCALGKFGGEDVQAARAMLRWTPTDKLDVLFTLHHSDDNSPVTAMQLAGVGDGVSENIPGTTIGLAPALQVFNDNVIGPAYGIQYDARFSTSDPFTTYATYDEVLFGENYPPVSTALTQGWSLSVDYDINDDLALKVIVADHDSDGQFSHDQDESPLPLYTVWNTVYSKETSYEVRLSGRAWNDRLDWTAGAFQWEADQHNGGQVSLRYYLLPFLVFPTTDYNFADNSGFYLHGVFALTDRLSLTTGWRTSDDDKRFEFSHFFDATVFTGGESEDWKIGLDYQINDTNMVYIQAATGYTASTFNGRPFTPDQLIGQPAEELEAYEIGYKTDFESARFSATYFYSDYATRVAGTGTLVDPVTMLPSTVAIAGPADINGLELEVSGTIGDNWIYNFNYGVLDYSAPEIGGGTPDPSTTCGFSTCIAADDGPEPPGQPRSNASAGLSYVGVLPNGGTITPRLDVFWTDTVQGLFSDSIIDAYSLTNFRVTYQTPDQDWSVSMALSNATDEFYVLNNFDLRGFGNPTFERQFGRPREWSLSFRHDF
jgi:iron complex outermembrane receptor protein